MAFDPTTLPWLEPEPADAKERVRSLRGQSALTPAEFQALVRYNLSDGTARALGRIIRVMAASGADLAPLSCLKLAILSNTTFDFIDDALPVAAARHGVALTSFVAPLDLIEQQLFDPASETAKFAPDCTLIALDHHWLGLEQFGMQSEDFISRSIDRISMILDGAASPEFGMPIVTTIPVPPQFLFGSLDRKIGSTRRAIVNAFNERLAVLCTDRGIILFDVAALAEYVGTARWFDQKLYNLYKLAFASDIVSLYADWLARILSAIRGKSRKCLVLDLDNTCWGGVIGDDGMSGIKIGQGSAEGESFLAIQKMALDLKARGIILAVSSKNTDAVAREPFQSHPDMALREGDIAVFQANWHDKPSNLEGIAKALDIGIDALVFLDDNAAERAQVRAALPMVAVPELPADAALYPDYLLAAGYFEAIVYSDEDRLRSDSYAANAKRAEIHVKARNLGDYLQSLAMDIQFAKFDDIGRPRIAQLVNKSNQFNLTTRRHTEADIQKFASDDRYFTLQVRLSDRFGDFGMIGVIVASEHLNDVSEKCLRVESWLMSCRVLGRKVEEAMFAELVAAAKQRGAQTILAEYIPTDKNAMVSDHFEKLGCALISENQDGHKLYRFSVGDYQKPELPFQGAMAG